MNDNSNVAPIVIPLQVYLMLKDKPALKSLYMDLVALNSIGFLESNKVKDLAEILGVAMNNLSTNCRSLMKLGLVEAVGTGRDVKYKISYPYHTADALCLRNFVNIKNSSNLIESRKTIESLSKNLCDRSKNVRTKSVSLNNILNKYNIDILNNINNRQRFPLIDYEKIEEAYRRITKVKLSGPELVGFRRDVRLMFMADHSVDEIIKFMKWLELSKSDKEVWFARLWTITTVRKYIAEYKAGRFDEFDGMDNYELIQ